MFWFKACRKCQGDLYEGGDVHGSYISCLQCSRYLTQAEEARLKLSASGRATLLTNATGMAKVAA